MERSHLLQGAVHAWLAFAEKKNEEALREMRDVADTQDNRFNGLAGAARAAELVGRADKANTYYGQLLKNCDDGRHSDRGELRRAKLVLAKNGL